MWTSKKKCVACGRRFAPAKDSVYAVEERQGVIQAIATPAQTFDAMDCPHCGCQNALAVRLPKIKAAVERDDGDE